MTIRIKPADQTKTSNTTLADDNFLVQALEANKRYSIKQVVFVNVGGSDPDIQWRFTLPAGADGQIGVHVGRADNSLDFAGASDENTTRDKALLTAGNTFVFVFQGWIETDATAGNVAFQWAQQTSSAQALTVQRGSWQLVQEMGVTFTPSVFVQKTADQSVANNTLVNDTHLTFTAQPNSQYAFMMLLHATNAMDTADFKMQYTTVPVGTAVKWTYLRLAAAGGNSPNPSSGTNAIAVPVALDITAADTNVFLVFGVIQVDSVGGTCTLQWAQNSTDAGNPTVLKQGSWLMAMTDAVEAANWQVAVKTADQSVSSNTALQNCTDLECDVEPNTRYGFIGYLAVDAATDQNMNIAVQAPSGSGRIGAEFLSGGPGASQAISTNALASSVLAVPIVAANTPNGVYFTGYMNVAGTGGIARVQFCQAVSSGNAVTVRENSWFMVFRTT